MRGDGGRSLRNLFVSGTSRGERRSDAYRRHAGQDSLVFERRSGREGTRDKHQRNRGQGGWAQDRILYERTPSRRREFCGVAQEAQCRAEEAVSDVGRLGGQYERGERGHQRLLSGTRQKESL